MWGMYCPQYGRGDNRVEHEKLTASVAITFLAQWHPLINPERNDLRPEYNNGPVKSPGFF